MTGYVKKTASAILALLLMVLAIPATTVTAAPTLATPCITAVKNETIVIDHLTTPCRLEWNKVEGATAYQVYRVSSVRVDNPKTELQFKLLATVKTNSYLDKTADAFLYYAYKVKAISDNGSSEFSMPVDTRFCPDAPKITGSTAGSKAVQLKWKKVKGVTGYQTMVSHNKKSGYKTKNVGRKTKANVRLLPATPGKKQYVTVRSYVKMKSTTYNNTTYGATTYYSMRADIKSVTP